MKYYPCLAFGVVLSTLGVSVALAQQIVASQTVSVPRVTAKVLVTQANNHSAVIDVRFSTYSRTGYRTSGTYNVNCLSGYRDIRYVLRDSAGKILPMNANAWKNHGDILKSYLGTCKQWPWTTKTSVVSLSDLYPNVPRGRYTLQMTLAPRDLAERASFTPVHIQF